MTFSEYREKFGIKLTPSQQEAVLRADGNTLLLAVPGSGKTTVIVARLGYMINCLGIPHGSILTLTYSVAACRDMKSRYISVFGKENVPGFRTIHGICSIIIREYARIKGTEPFVLLTDEAGLLTECYIRAFEKPPEPGTISEIKRCLTYAVNMMTDIDKASKALSLNNGAAAVSVIYEQEKRKRRLMDYDDQLSFALRILHRHPEILDAFRRKFRYINVDEAQDTSKIQHEIIRLLSSGNLFMVGDEDQSIYGFRAAYPEVLLNFQNIYNDSRILFMQENFRSTGYIVKRAARLIENNRDRREKHMFTRKENGEDIEIINLTSRREQYSRICSIADECRKSSETTAVLFRNNDSALPIIDMLDRKGIPYIYRDSDCPFFESPCMRDIMYLIDVVYDNNPESFAKSAKRLGCGFRTRDAEIITLLAKRKGITIARAMTEHITQNDDRFRRVAELSNAMERASRLSVENAIRVLCTDTCFGRFLKRRLGDVQQKTGILTELAAGCRSKKEFDKKINRLRDITQRGSSGTDGIILSTVHGSKGLEYDNVIIIDAKDGEFPCIENPERCLAKDASVLEEERRLFYVAVTRARKSVKIIRYTLDFGSEVCTRWMFVRELMKYTAGSDLKLSPVKSAKSRENPYNSDCDIHGFCTGAKVSHRIYGEGIIKDVQQGNCTVIFNSGKERKFALSVATKTGFLTLCP